MSKTLQQTYLFYDIETSGLNKAFDQVLQFAAIRTDLKLNEIARHEIIVRLSPDTAPSPGAVITHHISPADAANGVPEAEAIAQIHQLLNTPGTISLGYNTLGFDDEFLRFSFYRNLLPAYTHQYANQCSRLDLYPFAALYYLYKNEIINWPQIDDKPTLKLEYLSQANQLATGAAHTAIVDVIATVELAKHLCSENKMWTYAREFFNKNIAAERFAKLAPALTSQQQTFREGLYIAGSMGFTNAFQAPVLSLGNHFHYKNQSLWLRLDNEKLMQTTAETIAENTWVFGLKSGEANFVLPLTERYTQHLSVQRQLLAQQNKAWLQENPELFAQIIRHHKEYTYPKIPNLDVDAALYQNGFLSDTEQKLCARFNTLPWSDKAAHVEKFNLNLREQAIRQIGRNYPDCLTDKYAAEFAAYLKQVSPENEEAALIDYRGRKRLTPKTALAEIEVLKNSGNMSAKQLGLLDDLQQYLIKTFHLLG